MENDLILSIVIPTKNREYYCIECIKQIATTINNENTEIIVQDNSDKNTIEKEIRKIETKCIIKYYYSNKTISFVENFSSAIEKASGKYVCMIGDDDGVLSNILPITKYAIKNDIDAIIPSLGCVYLWPSSKPIISGCENGYMYTSFLSNKITTVDPKTRLKILLKNGGQNYQEIGTPRIYHGLVKREKLDEIKRITGAYFGGLTPDMYMTVALSFVCENVRSLGFPITISGICPRSGSSASATGEHTGKLKDAPHFIGHENYECDKRVPCIYSVETIWADTLLHCIKDMKKESYYVFFNKEYLLAQCEKKYSFFKEEINDYKKMVKVNTDKVYFYKKTSGLSSYYKRIKKRIINFNGVQKKYDVVNINMAGEYVDKILKKKRIGYVE